MTFAMALALDINSIKSGEFRRFFSTLAEREFGKELSEAIGAAWHEYDRLVSLRKHEHIEPHTFSLLNYNETEDILHRWETLLGTAEAIHQCATDQQRPSVFQLVLHPIKASATFIALQINLGRNQLYAKQRRNSANTLAQHVLDLFDADFNLSEEFHALLDGKWKYMMMQPHYGFGDTWHAPSRDMISGLCYVQRRQDSNPIAGQMGITVEGHEGVRPGRCNEESDRTHPSRRDLVPGVTLGALTRYGPASRWFDVFTRGSPTIHWSTRVPYNWIKLSVTSGTLIPGDEDARVEITIDWDQVPIDFSEEVVMDIRSAEGDFEQVHLPILGRKVPETFYGFVEGDGYICIPASYGLTSSYRLLPEVGRSSTGSVALNLHDEKHEVSQIMSKTNYLTYNAYFFTKSGTLELQLYFNMTLDIDPSDPMTYDILIDGNMQTHKLIPESTNDGDLPEGWVEAVQDCVWVKKHQFSGENPGPGAHIIQVGLKHSNMFLEKLVVNLGWVKESYLGPPPSYCVRKMNIGGIKQP